MRYRSRRDPAHRWVRYSLPGAVLIAAVAAASLGLASDSALARALASPPQNTAEPVISGTAAAGQTLSASSGSWSGDTPMTYTYQWRRCDTNGASCADISGATGSTYVAQSADVAFRLRVRVTATNGAGQASVDSNATEVVTEAKAPANTGQPAISGSPVQGQTLTTTTGSWLGDAPITYAYQWVRCGTDGGAPDGSNCTFIAGATATTYVLQSGDVGHRMRVRVTATNGTGSQTVASNATEVVTASPLAGPPKNTTGPSITGTPTQGQTLTAAVGSWAGAQQITYAYQWLRCDTNGNNCLALGGHTQSTYVLGGGDVNFRMRVRVTATNGQGSAIATSGPTTTVAAPLPSLPQGAIRLSNGRISIPVSSVSLPARLIIDNVHFTPSVVTTRRRPLFVRVHISDTRGYWIRDALVFVRSTPLLTTTPAEQTTNANGYVTLSLVPKLTFPLRRGHYVQFFLRARKAGEPILVGVSSRRLVQVATR
jgi:hypothetical protein